MRLLKAKFKGFPSKRERRGYRASWRITQTWREKNFNDIRGERRGEHPLRGYISFFYVERLCKQVLIVCKNK